MRIEIRDVARIDHHSRQKYRQNFLDPFEDGHKKFHMKIHANTRKRKRNNMYERKLSIEILILQSHHCFILYQNII